MSYQVWTKVEFEGWKRADCEDLEAVQAAILGALKAGQDPLVTVEVPFNVSIKFEEGKQVETAKGKAIKHKGAESKGDREVRRGDETVTPGLDQGSGDNSAAHSAGD